MTLLPKSQFAAEQYNPEKSGAMKKLIAGVTLTAITASSAMAGYTTNDDYQITAKVIPVVLQRGDQVEYGRLVYTAWVHKHEQETGKSSKPLEGHFIDDRQCNWQVSGHMQRQYFVTSLMGEEDGQAASTVHLPIQLTGQSNGLASFLDHDPCSDYRGHINKTVADAKRTVGEQFDARLMADLEAFKKELTGVTVVVNPQS